MSDFILLIESSGSLPSARILWIATRGSVRSPSQIEIRIMNDLWSLNTTLPSRIHLFIQSVFSDDTLQLAIAPTSAWHGSGTLKSAFKVRFNVRALCRSRSKPSSYTGNLMTSCTAVTAMAAGDNTHTSRCRSSIAAINIFMYKFIPEYSRKLMPLFSRHPLPRNDDHQQLGFYRAQ